MNMNTHDGLELDGMQRRQFLNRAALAAACTPLLGTIGLAQAKPSVSAAAETCMPAMTEPFWGRHQGGIATSMQRHSYFVAFDLLTDNRDDVVGLLRHWTDAAAEMTRAPEQFAAHASADQPATDSGVAVGLPASRLTVTFGFGAGLFEKNGKDRYGLARRRPAALVDLPHFAGDQLDPQRTGGDLAIQVCADDIQVVEYTIRRLAVMASGTAVMRWAQSGFAGGFKPGDTPRNLMGFKDGTLNIDPDDASAMRRFVWVGEEGPDWLRDGSYMVVRPIRISLEHWDQMKTAFQEQTFGRQKVTGAPPGGHHERDALDMSAQDRHGDSLIAENSHAAMALPANNDGAQILRRSYSYDNGIARIAERWPPWRQAMMFDAGLLFQCYQRDPRTGFIKLFERMSKFDMLNQFTTHVGSGLYACPPAARPGGFVGEALFA